MQTAIDGSNVANSSCGDVQGICKTCGQKAKREGEGTCLVPGCEMVIDMVVERQA